MDRKAQWLIVTLAGGVVAAAAFALAADPLAPLGLLEVSFWVTAVIIVVAGILGSLVLIDLKRAFSAAIGMAVLATLVYALAIWSPASQMGHYSTHLLNYAMVQAVPVLIVTAVLAAVGTLIGTVVNTSVREYDL